MGVVPSTFLAIYGGWDQTSLKNLGVARLLVAQHLLGDRDCLRLDERGVEDFPLTMRTKKFGRGVTRTSYASCNAAKRRVAPSGSS